MRSLPLLFLVGACGATADFSEVTERGLADYLGAYSPVEETESGDSTRYAFGESDGDGPICLRGGEYRMATREGPATDRLLIFLEPGGACWSGLCEANATASARIPDRGAMSTTLAANPFATWDVGYLPYCDGALFAGDAAVDDDDDGQIDRYHHGLQNLSAALDVLHAKWPEPERIALVGSSAGAYGTMLAAVLTREVYPDARIDVFADGGLGIGRPGEPEFIAGVLDEWNVTRLVPASCTECVSSGHMTPIIGWGLERDPNMTSSVISATRDLVIGTTFLGLTGPEYEEAVFEQTDALYAAYPDQFGRFLFRGAQHTVLLVDSTVPLDSASAAFVGVFDETEVGGVTVAEWMAHRLADEPEASVTER